MSTVRSTRTIFVSRGFVRVEEKATKSLFCNLVRHFLEKMSLTRALLVRHYRQWFGRISSTVRPFCQMKVRPFSKTGRRLVLKKSSTTGELR